MPASALYLYCVVKSAKRPSLARAPAGLPRGTHPAATSLASGLWLIAADVPLDVYGPDPLEASLRDLEWVSAVALAHEAVVEHFSRTSKLRGTTVVPMKLFTMFSSLDRAVEEMRARLPEIRNAMKRIAGCEEWGVRVIRSQPRRTRSTPARGAATGAAFLAAKKRAKDEAVEAALAAVAAADEAYGALAAVARDARRRDDVPESATTPPLLDAAFLVAAPARTRFKSAAKRAAIRCGRAGAEMTLSGPWPAYNFVHAPERRG